MDHPLPTVTIQKQIQQQQTTSEQPTKEVLIANFSTRISRVGKARATAGALQLLRLLCHPVIVNSSKDPQSAVECMREVFTYHTRGDLPSDQSAGIPLMHSILDFIAAVGTDQTILQTPEMYDVLVFAFQLLFVLCGTQLYQPFQSSFESNNTFHYILEEIFRVTAEDDTIEESNNLRSLWMSSRSSISMTNTTNSKDRNSNRRHGKRRIWTPQSILEICLQWQIRRPIAPERSLSHYYYILAKAAVSTNAGETIGPDGMYESHMVVQATAPPSSINVDGNDTSNDSLSEFQTRNNPNGSMKNTNGTNQPRRSSERHNIIIDATKGVLTLSGTIILLPFRLVSLVFGVFAANKKGSHNLRQGAMMKKFASTNSSRTRDVLWLSDSILADLGSSLILLLANNKRNGDKSNPFRSRMKGLTDNRWDQEDGGLALPDLPNFNMNGVNGLFDNNESFRIEELEKTDVKGRRTSMTSVEETSLTLNFESLFLSFGRTLHNEVGALLLYTLLQSSPSFAESLAVRSDLDTLIMPLLRTLYFASRNNTYISKDYATKRTSVTSTTSKAAGTGTTLDIRSCPFRSPSQLYVIAILLLLFSQDPSFGRDAFKRISVSHVVWYKERHLKNINLGSIVLLTMFRSLLFNLNRLQDVFLLSNCCAVLQNLSPSVVGLHEYAAMRLASVTVTVMKKHTKLAESSIPTTWTTHPSNHVVHPMMMMMMKR